MFKYFSIIAFLSIACGSLGPQDGDAAPPIVEPSFDPVLAAELSTAFDDAIAATGAVSGVAAVWRRYGGMWLGSTEAISPVAPLRIGSITKPFVAACALQLVDAGKLELDATIDRWFPALPSASAITVRDLLQHTSGIVDYMQVTAFREDFYANPQRRWDVASIEGYIESEPRLFTPGARWSYSNSGYYLLGAILEEVSGQSLGNLLRETIWQPLAVTSPVYEMEETPTEPLVPGYSDFFGTWSNVTSDYDISVAGPAGAVAANAGDLAKAIGQLKDQIPPALHEAWLDTVPAGGIDYGLGIMDVPLGNGRRALGHFGDIWGYQAYAFTIPEALTTVVVLLGDDESDINTVFLALLDTLGL